MNPRTIISFTPLLHYLERTIERADAYPIGDSDIADSIGVSRETVFRWRHLNQLPFFTADVIACRLGFHPSYLWGDEYWAILNMLVEEDEERRVRKLEHDKNRRLNVHHRSSVA